MEVQFSVCFNSKLILSQDNYLIEVKGDVQDSLPSIDEDSQQLSVADGENVRVYYMVHPTVDMEGGSTFTSTSGV